MKDYGSGSSRSRLISCSTKPAQAALQACFPVQRASKDPMKNLGKRKDRKGGAYLDGQPDIQDADVQPI